MVSVRDGRVTDRLLPGSGPPCPGPPPGACGRAAGGPPPLGVITPGLSENYKFRTSEGSWVGAVARPVAAWRGAAFRR